MAIEPTLDELAVARAAGYQAGRDGKPREAPGGTHVPIPSLRDGGPEGDGQVVDALGMAWLEGWRDGARDGARLAGWLARMSEVATAHGVTAPFAPPPWAGSPLTAGAWLDGWQEAGEPLMRSSLGAPVVVPLAMKPIPPVWQAPTMWAHVMERYKARHGFDNADLADRLHGTIEDVVLRLALCQLPDARVVHLATFANGDGVIDDTAALQAAIDAVAAEDAAYWRDLAARTTLSEPTLRAFLAELLAEE